MGVAGHSQGVDIQKFYADIRPYEGLLYAKAYRYYNGNVDDASDLLQDTLHKALVNRDKFREGTNLRAWLLTIMYRTFVTRHLRRANFLRIIHTQPQLVLGGAGGETQKSPYHGCGQGFSLDMRNILKTLEGGMNPKFYPVLMLVDVLDKSYKEAGDILGIPEGTVMSRLYRARREARGVLQEYLGADEVNALMNAAS